MKMKKWQKTTSIGLACIIAIMLIVMIASPLFALTPASAPTTSMTLTDVKVFSSTAKEGDVLVIYQYKVGYDSYAASIIGINNYFSFRFMDTANNSLGVSTPFGWYGPTTNAIGWGENVGSFYFSSEEASASHISSASTFNIVISPMPGAFSTTVNNYSYSVTSQKWDESATQEDSIEALTSYIIEMCSTYEQAYGQTLISNEALNSVGVAWIERMIPGIFSMAPGLNPSNIKLEDPTIDDYQQVGHSLIDEWEAQWDGTWVETSLTAIGELLGGMSWRMVTSMFILLIWVILAAFAQIKWGTTDPALWGGMCAASFGVCLGVMEWSVVGVICLFFIFYSVYILFWRQG